MKKLIIASMMLTIAAVTPAFAAEPGFVGNTIVLEAAGFGRLTFAMGADKKFTRSDGVTGTWTYDGSTLCFHAEGQDDLCGYFNGSKHVGENWEDPAWDGNGNAQITILEGLG